MASERLRGAWGITQIVQNSGNTGGTPSNETLDADKYLGSVGLEKDKPVDDSWPHFIRFPAANKGEWFLSVSDAKINDTDLNINQRWMCKADNTKIATPANWGLIQPSDSETGLLLVGNCTRLKPQTTELIAKPNITTKISFATAFTYAGKIVYADGFRTEITNWFPLVSHSAGPYLLDLRGFVDFDENPQGWRSIYVNARRHRKTQIAGAKENNELLLGATVNGTVEDIPEVAMSFNSIGAAPAGRTRVPIQTDKRDFGLFSDNQLVVSLYASHNAPVDIKVLSAQLTITCWAGGKVG